MVPRLAVSYLALLGPLSVLGVTGGACSAEVLTESASAGTVPAPAPDVGDGAAGQSRSAAATDAGAHAEASGIHPGAPDSDVDGGPVVDAAIADAGAGDADAGPHTRVSFSVDGESFEAETVTVSRQGGVVEIVATHVDGANTRTLTIAHASTDQGHVDCALSFPSPMTPPHVALVCDLAGSNRHYESGYDINTSSCTFDIVSSSPAIGTAQGQLTDLISRAMPAQFSATWADGP